MHKNELFAGFIILKGSATIQDLGIFLIHKFTMVYVNCHFVRPVILEGQYPYLPIPVPALLILYQIYLQGLFIM